MVPCTHRNMPFNLPNAVVGQVVTRFPPEPSWIIDIGHCKASLMNQFVATQFKGKWILRFDDTNPKTCSRQNVESYLQDMPLLGLTPDRTTYASDYFERMIATTTQLLEAGFIYADDTPVEEMRAQRLCKQASPQRSRPVHESLAAWEGMQAGTEAGQLFCLRFKLNPESENGALRDPVAWRGIDTQHYKTGTRYKVYPTYDFAAPWLDLAEGVTHALRTLEFRDRDELYQAVQQAVLKLHPEWRASTIWEFPRIHMSYAPQAKVHQKALLAAGLVEGPDDPRLPTLRGLMRAGCHPEALRAFLLEQVTPARKETYHSWDKLWTLNRRLLDPTAARHMAVADEGRVLVKLLDGPDDPEEVQVAWKQGHKVQVVRYREIWIDQEDAQILTEGDEFTVLAWGNAIVKSIQQEPVTLCQQEDQQLKAPTAQPLQQQPVSPPSVADTAAAFVSTQPQRPGQLQHPDAHGVSTSSRKPPVPPVLSACKGTAATSSSFQGAAGPSALDTGSVPSVFSGFKDVFALRDQLAVGRRAGFGSSSCASTAGSTSVALGALLADLEGAGEDLAQDPEEGAQADPREAPNPAATDWPSSKPSAAQHDLQTQHQQQMQQHQKLTAEYLHATQQLQVPCSSNGSTTQASSSPQGARVRSITAVLNPEGDPKSSKVKLHWLPNLPERLIPLRLVFFDHPVTVEKVVEDVDVVTCFNGRSRVEALAWGDPSLLMSARCGNVVQLQRKGFFIIDKIVLKADTATAAAALEAAATRHAVVPVGAEATCSTNTTTTTTAAAEGGQPPHVAVQQLQRSDVEELVMFYIPDGHTKKAAQPMTP